VSARRAATRFVLAAVPLAFVALFFLWPVGAILARGVWRHGGPDTGAFRSVFDDPALAHVARFTVWQAFLSTVLTLAVGLPAAAVLARGEFHGRRALRALLVVPFVLPTIVVATAFQALGVERSLGAILLAHCFFNVAVVVRIVGTAWEALDPRIADSARVLGAGPARVWWNVTLPALRNAILTAASIVFLFCFTSFGVILILGGPRFATLETEIYRYTADLLDLRTAAALSVVQLVAVVATMIAAALAARRATGLRPLAASPRPRSRPPTLGARALGTVALLPALVLVVVPITELVQGAFAHGGDGFTRLTETPVGLPGSPVHAVVTSLRIALVATVVAGVLGLMLATGITRERNRLGRLAELLVVLPLGVSAVTVGFGFLIVFDRPPIDLRTSWAIVTIAHAHNAQPVVVRTAVPILASVDPHVRDAATMLGASPARVWWEVDRHAVARATAVAAGFAFAISLGEFGATLFIVRPETTTVPVEIYRLLGRPGATNLDTAMALTVVLMVMTAAVALLGDLGGTFRRKPA
jgi:thiamine transport system permease protein